MTQEVGDTGKLWLTALAIAVGLTILIFATPLRYLHQFNGNYVRFFGAVVIFIVCCLQPYWHARRRPRLWIIIVPATLAFVAISWWYFFVAVPKGAPTLIFAAILGIYIVMVGLILYHVAGIAPRYREPR